MENSNGQMQFYDIYDVWYTPWYKSNYCYAVCGFIFLLILYFLYQWYKKRKVPVVKLSPSQKALHDIEHLKKGSYKDYAHCYSLLTQALKIYLEEEYTLSLKGLTDDEFIKTIALQPAIAAQHVENLKIIFDGITYIKFAGQDAQEKQLHTALDNAYTFIKKIS